MSKIVINVSDAEHHKLKILTTILHKSVSSFVLEAIREKMHNCLTTNDESQNPHSAAPDLAAVFKSLGLNEQPDNN